MAAGLLPIRLAEMANTSSDQRAHQRYQINRAAWIAWTSEHGLPRRVPAVCYDLSKGGACVQVHEAIPVGTALTLGVPVAALETKAVVRRCGPGRKGFALGVEFETPLP